MGLRLNMRVLHVITNFTEKGGAEGMLSRLIASTPNCQHFIISLMNISPNMYEDTLQRCESFFELKWKIQNTFLILIKLIKLINLIKPDVIQCWMYHPNFFAPIAVKLSHVKPRVYANVRHSLEDYSHESFSTKVALRLGCFTSKMTDGIVFCSRNSAEQHRKFGYFSGEYIYIPNGYDFSKIQQKHESSMLIEKIIIGTAGRFNPAKNYKGLLMVAAELLSIYPNLLFRFAGRGVSFENPEFVELIDAAGISYANLELLGQVSDMSSFYQSLDIFVLASDTEGFPNVLAEAMAHGIPAVTTDVGDAAVVAGSVGVVVPPKNHHALVLELQALINLTAHQRASLGNICRRHILENFSINIIALNYMKLWSGAALCVE